MIAAPFDFAGNERFQIVGELGRGGMGVVYRALDQERRCEVALKTLLELDPEALYRFKREFRSLADIVHPNLISLHELWSVTNRWFFTMELIDGVDFLAHVADVIPPETAPAFTYTTESPTVRAIPADVTPKTPRKLPSRRPPADVEKLRPALRQLCDGVAALHAAGFLHCDIKPSNVLVTAEGRVVLLDFGVIAEAQTTGAAAAKRTIGTPAYMAPEQARGQPSPASDWYAVGVILFEALTGQRLFEGSSIDVLNAKQTFEAPAPSSVADGVPEDLDRLCCDLLRLSVRDRAGGREVMRVLGGKPGRANTIEGTEVPAAGTAPVALVGRGSHLEQLRAAYAAARTGGRAVYLHGPSGSGKSTLARHFFGEISADDHAIVLSGRCYQRESVPYQALDSLVDALSHFLERLPRHEAEVVMPRNVLWLAKMFPVLDRVTAFAAAANRTKLIDTPEPQELRRIAFAALRDLLGRLAETRPVVLFIDDLQWGDADSAPLLEAITRPPDAPAMLLLATYRDEDASPLLDALFRQEQRVRAELRPIRIPVGALTSDDARALALEADTTLDASETDTIVAESGGNPFFVRELARYARARSRRTGRKVEERLSLDAVIRERVAELPATSRALLEVVAVAARPIPQSVAHEAAEIAGADRPRVVHELSVGQLVRLSGPREADVIACYHDRIRQAVVDGLSAEALRGAHARLAGALETTGEADAETLAEHFHASGDDEKATSYAIRAADQAATALAFDRAARLYTFALDTRNPTGAARRELEVKLGDALVNAGRCAEGGDIYLAAAGSGRDATSLELRRRAAEQFLQSGHTDRGLTTMASVLKQLGLRLPRTSLGAVPSWIVQKIRLYLRGLRYRARAVADISPMDLLRIDTCFAVATGMSLIDSARAAPFTTRNLLLALHAGEESRIAVALAIEAAFVSSQGKRAEGRSNRLQDRAEAIAERLSDAKTTAVTVSLRGFAFNQRGRFPESLETTTRAEAMLRACEGGTWLRKSMELMTLGALMYMGEYGELSRQVPIRLAEAEQTGDQFAISNLRSLFLPIVLLHADDPDGARRAIAEAETQHSETAHMQRSFEHLLQVQTELYVGNGAAAYSAAQSAAKVMARSLISQIELMRGVLLHYRASAAILVAAQSPRERGRMLRRANRDARRMMRTKTPWLRALGERTRALAAAVRGDPKAAELLREVIARCDAAHLYGWAAGARWRLGRIIGGAEGDALVGEGVKWLRDRGAAAPERLAAAITPG